MIHNERWKLTANWLNTVAAGTIIAGSLSPLVATTYGLPTAAALFPAWLIVALPFVWISVGIMLHMVARAILGRLKE
ncbi:hypothetical protein C7477_102212 [Phyllobacterium leguminum]|uniref:Uncharacterized protein n=1 Tax=Phyllobacterium leguminum TaxID=314237 RepID=A0A318T6P6_9HYPH|nr:hypothetical protein C7477_102212 [Phyllobacterium leguminum]